MAYEDALRNLSSRIDSDDLKLFVISVIIQRTSGGNLAEILENIGRLIRERFKLKGNVQTLTAEGRISAYILLALPFFLGLRHVPPEPALHQYAVHRPDRAFHARRCRRDDDHRGIRDEKNGRHQGLRYPHE